MRKINVRFDTIIKKDLLISKTRKDGSFYKKIILKLIWKRK